MTAKHRIALIGTGSMGSLHARVMSQSDRAELVRVIDPREEAGRAVADRFGAQWTPEIGTLDGIDGVVLAAATEVHHKIALDVLNQGVPLLVEKPVCDDLDASEEVVALSESRDIPMMCGLLERYNPAVMTALHLLNEPPVHVTARRHGPYAPRIKTGVSWDLLVHDVDLAIRCFNGAEPTRVASGVGYFHPDSVPGAEDNVETVLTFPRGLATVSASRIGQRKVRSLLIAEIDRLIEIDLLRRDVTIYRHVSHDAVTPDGLGYRQQTVIEIPELISGREPLATQLDRFLDLIEGKVDAAEERRSILPAHRVVSQVLASSKV